LCLVGWVEGGFATEAHQNQQTKMVGVAKPRTTLPKSVIKCAGIEDRLWGRVPAQHYKQIAHHRCSSFRIEVENVLLAQHLESMLDHPYRSSDDLAPRGYDGPCLLPLKHRRGDFPGICRIADSSFLDFGRIPRPVPSNHSPVLARVLPR